MSLMETIIVVAALLAMGGGGLILLHTLAVHRRHLFQALKIEMDVHAREQRIKEQLKQEQMKKHHKHDENDEEIVTVGNPAG
ncbi:MAG: hypothetical protein JW709_07130 [Sedimentisphaerales bacterium]|nr:hypothetical protein [Sedimentisphaerales bacterium]